MKKSFRVSAEIKQQILTRLKTENISVKTLAEEHGIGESTIYKWLTKTTTGTVSMREHMRLVKENKHLKELLSQTMLSLSIDQKRG